MQYLMLEIGEKTQMDLLQGNQHVNSCWNSSHTCLGSIKEKRIKSKRRIIKMFSRRKYLRRKMLTLLMLNVEMKFAYQCLGLWGLNQNRPYWFREADLEASQNLLEIVPETLVFHECLSIISLPIPAYLSKCFGNKKERIMQKPQMEMWDFQLKILSSQVGSCDALQSSRVCLGVQALGKMPWSWGKYPKRTATKHTGLVHWVNKFINMF